MIRSALIQNFRCFWDVRVDFAPVTFLVGPNASGKTSILDALHPHQPPSRDDVWQRDAERKSTIRVEVDGPNGVVSFERFTKSNFQSQPYTWQLLHFDLAQMRGENQVQEDHRLDPTGANLANVLATLSRRQQEALSRDLSRLVPVYADVDVRPRSPGRHRVVLQDRWNPALWYEPWEVSDGTLLLLAFLILQYQTPAADVVAIEEPERGLHPYLLEQFVGLLRKLAGGELGKPVQVILATHSAELLEFARPEEVRFLSRRPQDGSVMVEAAPTDTEQWERAFNEYGRSIGSIWLSGGLGGVPGS